MAKIDRQEEQAVQLFNERYVMNAKKPKMKKIFDRVKLENNLKTVFSSDAGNERGLQTERRSLYERVRKAFS